jgi:hypothetical protein
MKKSNETEGMPETVADEVLGLSQEIRAIGLNAKDSIKSTEVLNKEN